MNIALRILGMEYIENQLKSTRQMREKLKHDLTTSDNVRLKRFDKANKRSNNLKKT